MSCAVGQNSLTPQGNNELNFRLARDMVVFLEIAANLCISQRPANDFKERFSLFFSLEV